MKTKQEIVQNWLPRYTGQALQDFGQYILLTNFENYVRMFAERHNVPVNGLDRPMRSATAEGITIINFGMGSPNAATIMDCLSAIAPKAALFLGKCGGLKKKEQHRGPHTSDRRHSRRGNLQRLFSAGSPCASRLRPSKGHLDHHPRLRT